jgi:tripartite-type tricarboxylate transporter receptor subunit TctC
MRVPRRSLLALLPAPALAGTPATLLVGGPAGSGADQWARGVAPFLERHWARATITVVNRPGLGGMAAARALAAAAADGLTLAAVGTPVLLARAVEQGELPLLERLHFVASIAEEPLLLVAPAAAAAQTLDSLRVLPPTALLGTPPGGSAAQLMGTALAAQLGLTPFAFANAAAVRQAVQAGHVQAAMLAAPDAMALLREGKLTVLAVAADRRSPLLPETPTLRELGLRLAGRACRGFALPGGTPLPAVNNLAMALRAVVNDPEFIAQADAFGYRPDFQGPDEWMGQVRAIATELASRWQTDPWSGRSG